MIKDITIPDIGDFKDVAIVEISVKPGDRIAAEDTILMLESDKATMDIPAPVAGTVTELLVAEGDRVSAGTPVMRVETEAQTTAPSPAPAAPATASEDHADLLVIGAGPGGYTAAFRAADLGRKVVLIDTRPTLGGVCLNVGCIPSKALLHVAKLIDDAAEGAAHGVSFGAPQIDLDAIRGWKDQVVGKLTGGLSGLARRRKVQTVQGTARFTGPHEVEVATPDGTRRIRFDQAIIAAGSSPVRLPFLPDDPRIIDSTGALDLAQVPQRLLVLGGGIIGLEMAQVYHALGSRITIAERLDQIIPGADKDVVKPLMARISARYEAVHLETSVTAVQAGKALTVSFEGKAGSWQAEYDAILVAVGRRPNGALLGAEAAGVTVTDQGFIPVDAQMRTGQPHIFAIGDVVGQPMLAHKATHEAKVAAETACGHKAAFDPVAIPSGAYTDPEIAWAGLTETQARAEGRKLRVERFPWAASGRALSMGRAEGLTKMLFDPDTGRVLGAAITGPNAGELLAEAVLAIEMAADAADLALTIHPHPTLSETLGFAAEAFEGTLTDL
ncbi:dihydrolipoyl dehydrogenase [Paracoccus siganidrum]|uniref:Dihydrolipoyl dehydrogenase n=1 Tax=Paracoccus siganidrum TaxID=1276757 RepID=A0A418ZZA4_9RHOB|nr:dihydrolipoyl dehydrogenase [Paracoccus siganidrum]RJL05896.1 dihydrolipoyl dehydrogenase [Paracoccus siganidrum]RMC30010.1 dihydrolipoyl dehydrogenase [Paracoccus siganidrum]